MLDFGVSIIDMEEHSKRVSLSHNNALTLMPEKGIRFYNVSHRYYEGTTLDEIKQLDYDVSIAYLNENESSYPYRWRIQKKDVFFNRKQSSLVIEEISVMFMEVIYPIHITTDHTGLILEITNHQEILDRWSIIKPKLIQLYVGNLVFKMIEKFENLIKDLVKLEISLSKEIFWSVFFNNIYQEYDTNYKRESIVLFPLEAYKTPILYKGKSTLTPMITAYDSIKLEFQGEALLPFSSNLYKNRKNHKLTSALNIEYHLETDTKIPRAIKTFYDVYDETQKEDLKQVEVLITLDESEKPDKNQTIQDKKDSVSNNSSISKKKKKWFSFGFKNT
ncbi:hypothetical protein [Aquimarina sp. RZ0]|uniref:hypothetical protein n=1 Tax=Aquimarina sp. RZ0 TaxID=2607730 RepID=UPI0011F35212|nr:hypothetical protein [Aquimarina sp. RZ0]KAA1242405.1 hypothetical protein F0000_25720 [Aquimarina sp. RZ0]